MGREQQPAGQRAGCTPPPPPPPAAAATATVGGCALLPAPPLSAVAPCLPAPAGLTPTMPLRCPAAASMPGRLDRGAGASWGQLMRQHAAQWAGLAVLLLLLGASERCKPFQRAFYTGHTSDMDVWK